MKEGRFFSGFGAFSSKSNGKVCNILPSDLMRAGRRAVWAVVVRSVLVALVIVRLAAFAPSVFRYAAAEFAAVSMENAYAELLESNAAASAELAGDENSGGEKLLERWRSLPTEARITDFFYETAGCFKEFRLKYAGFTYGNDKLVARVVLDVRPDDGDETRAAFLAATEKVSGMKGAVVRSEPVPGSVEGLVVTVEFPNFAKLSESETEEMESMSHD